MAAQGAWFTYDYWLDDSASLTSPKVWKFIKSLDMIHENYFLTHMAENFARQKRY